MIPSTIDLTRPYSRYDRPRPPQLGSTPREGAGLTYPNRYAQPWDTETIYVFSDALDRNGLAQSLRSADGRVTGAAVVAVGIDGSQTGYASEQAYIAICLKSFYLSFLGQSFNAIAQLQAIGSGCAWARTVSS